LYECGNFLNDYEGIGGHVIFQGDLGLMYFVQIDPLTGRLLSLKMAPTHVRYFRVNYASSGEAAWLTEVLNREGKRFGTSIEIIDESRLRLLSMK